MSLDATTEQAAVIARLKATVPTVDARVFDFVPEEQELERDAMGLIVEPYLIVTFGSLYPKVGDRSIEGPEQQPFLMPIIVECWAGRAYQARDAAGEVRVSLVGWSPDDDNAEVIDLQGGGWFDKRDSSGRPVRWMESVTAITSINNSVEIP